MEEITIVGFIAVVVKKSMKYLFALALLLLPVAARAEVFVWTDPTFDISMAFPDNWMRQAQTPDDLRLYILAPQGMDHAACRIFASEDGKYMYIPPRGQHQISQQEQDAATLRALLADRMGYKNVQLTGYQDLAGLGKGPATVAVATYTKTWNDRDYAMQSIQFGGYYHGLESVFHCEALQQAWGRWSPLFMNMVKSFDFPARFASHPQGYYRDFMADGYVFLPAGMRQGTVRY